jgi:hypothetical protein
MAAQLSVAGAVLRSDLRAVIRDRTVAPVLVVPLIFTALVRFGLPRVAALPGFPSYAADLILAVLCSVAAVLPSLVLGMNAVDERDQGMFRAYQVLPVPMPVLFGIRLGWATALGAMNALIMVWLGVPDRYPVVEVPVLAVACALACPVLASVVVLHAANKIEGLALFKGMIFVHVLGALGLLVHPPWGLVFRVLPSYWGYLAFTGNGPASVLLPALIATVFYGVILALLIRQLRQLTE